MTTCTECGAIVPADDAVCPRCRRPKWYTLRKMAICLVALAVLIIAIKVMVLTADRTLHEWFG